MGRCVRRRWLQNGTTNRKVSRSDHPRTVSARFSDQVDSTRDAECWAGGETHHAEHFARAVSKARALAIGSWLPGGDC